MRAFAYFLFMLAFAAACVAVSVGVLDWYEGYQFNKSVKENKSCA